MSKVLIACEYSQIITKALRALGIEAFSCDILPTEGNPDWHFQCDVREILHDGWIAMIAHPDCTYLTNAGVCHLHTDESRWDKMRKGAEFFKLLLDAPIEHKAIENPIMHKYAVEIIGRRQDQVTQPHMFGHAEQKATCLWLEGLPKLVPTFDVKRICKGLPDKDRQRLHYLSPGKDRWKERSRTFSGLAYAMALQWEKYFNE